MPAPPPVQHESDGTRAAITSAQQYRPRLVRYFKNHLNTPDDAEDMAQETLMRMMRDPQAAQVANIEAYLMTIAGNLLRDRFRRDRTRHVGQHVPIDENVERCLTESVSGERVYQDQERLRTFVKHLDELPPRCQQVFLLHRYEGLTYSAIATQLGVSVSAVEKQMMRALLHFNTHLELS